MKPIKFLGIVLLAILAGAALAGWLLNRHHADNERIERELRDSLAQSRAQIAIWREREHEATVILQTSNRLLDSALARAPHIVYVTRTRTIEGSGGAQPTTVIDSLPYVPQSEYDTLSSRCKAVQRDCATLLAAKDTVISKTEDQARHLTELLDLAHDDLARSRRTNLLKDVRNISVAGLVGAGMGAVSTALVCRR